MYKYSINLLTPNVNYSGRTAPLTSKVSFYIFIQQKYVPNILNMVYTFRFFSSKCSLFHNSNVFGSCIIHILYTGCAKKKNSGTKWLIECNCIGPTNGVLFVKLARNLLTPNDPYRCRTAPLTSKRCILYIYSTNIGIEYFKHGSEIITNKMTLMDYSLFQG